MATYDNLNIATTTLIFDGENNSSIASGTFDLSTLAFLPNVPLIDQIEVERIFDTGGDTKFSENVFTIADRRQMFIFPKDWYTINEQTKVLTFTDLSAIPIWDDNDLYYPYSRTYVLENNDTINIPTIQAQTTSGTVVRQADKVYIRRKTPSINSIVTFAPGTRLTTTQLNLQFDQLKYIVQELVAKFRNEAILKYDENAVDGPFLGQSDLKMSANYVKDLGDAVGITDVYADIPEATSNITYQGGTFAASIGSLYDAVTQYAIHRENLSLTQTTGGNFTASNLKLTNLANGVSATDAATVGQIGNASNLTSGTLAAARIADGSLSLGKLSAAAGQGYTLPSDALPIANSLVATTSFGSSSGSNTNNMVYLTADTKGRLTAVNHRNLVAADLPDSGVTASTYGDSTTVLTQVTVDSKGRITAASERALTSSDIPSVSASVIDSGTLNAARLPSGVVTAGTTSIPNSITVDTYGRVTSVSGGSITSSNVSDFATASNTRIDARALSTNGGTFFDAGTKKISNVVDPTSAQDVVTKNYLEANAVYATGTNLSAGNKYLTNLIMRPSGTLSSTDAVNFGYLESAILNAGGTVIGTSAPQVFRQTWASATSITASTPTAGYTRYRFNFVDGTNPLYATSATMVLIEGDGGAKIYTPNAVDATSGTVYDGYFWLDTSAGTTKTLNVYVNSTPPNSVTIRNFGLSRLVSGGVATTSSTGLVSITAGNDGGISVTGLGSIALIPATTTQLGGVKVNTSGGLTNTAGLIAVNLSDSISTSSSTTVASSKAVNDLRLASVLLDGSQSMTGKLTTATSSTSIASLNLPSGVAPTSPVIGDVWNQSGTLKVRTDGTITKDVAYTSSSITGNAATATALAAGRTISLTGAVTGTSTAFDGTANLSFATTLATGQAVTSLTGIANQVIASASTGAVTLSLPQSIGTSSGVTFGTATLGTLTLGLTPNTINTSSGNLTLDSTGGTTTINDNTSIAGSLTVTGSNTATLGGAVTLNDSLALSTAAAKVALGGTAAVATTSIERLGTAAGVSSVGDIILRTPASGKAYVVSNATNTTVTTASDAVVTKGVLDTAIAGITGFMPTGGAVNAGTQTLGTSNVNAFVVKTNNTDRLTIASGGGVTLANSLTVSTGGVTISADGLNVTGNSAVTGTLTVSGTITASNGIAGNAKAITNVANPTNAQDVATKNYVDTSGTKMSINYSTASNMVIVAVNSAGAGLIPSGWTVSTSIGGSSNDTVTITPPASSGTWIGFMTSQGNGGSGALDSSSLTGGSAYTYSSNVGTLLGAFGIYYKV